MANTNTHPSNLTPVTLTIRFKSETLEQFIDRYSVDVSQGGIFIRTKAPLDVGTTLIFEFLLKDSTPLISGDGTVVWSREHDPSRPNMSPGMGVRFDKLSEGSQQTLDLVMSQKARQNVAPSGSGTFPAAVPPFDDAYDDDAGGFLESPTQIAPPALLESLKSPRHIGNTQAPFPRSVGNIGGENEFDEKLFSQQTRVAPPGAMLAKSKEIAPEPAVALHHVPDTNTKSFTEATMGNNVSGNSEDKNFAHLAAATSTHQSAGATSAPLPPEDVAETSFADLNDDLEGEFVPPSHPTKRAVTRESSVKSRDAPLETKARRALARAAEEANKLEEEESDSRPWIFAAAIAVLVVGFWLLARDNNSAESRQLGRLSGSKPINADSPLLEENVQNDASPLPPTREVTLNIVPAGATLSVHGTEMTGIAPASFELEDGKSFKINVEHPEFLPQTIDVVVDGSTAPTIFLQKKPKILHLTSQPPGATVTVDGIRLKQSTPVDMPISEEKSAKPALRVQMRRSGYKVVLDTISMTEGWDSKRDALKKTFDAELRPSRSTSFEAPSRTPLNDFKNQAAGTREPADASAPESDVADNDDAIESDGSIADETTPDWMR